MKLKLKKVNHRLINSGLSIIELQTEYPLRSKVDLEVWDKVWETVFGRINNNIWSSVDKRILESIWYF